MLAKAGKRTELCRLQFGQFIYQSNRETTANLQHQLMLRPDGNKGNINDGDCHRRRQI
ncbi:hypothetical protein LguiB_030232 [Lonicera macranthoides]